MIYKAPILTYLPFDGFVHGKFSSSRNLSPFWSDRRIFGLSHNFPYHTSRADYNPPTANISHLKNYFWRICGSFWQSLLFYWQFGCAIVIPRGYGQSIRVRGDYQMKNINWFKYKQYLGYAIDLGRIFPLLSKQKGLSKFLLSLYYQMVEIINIMWILLQDIGYQISSFMIGVFPGWFYEFGIANLINIRLETAAKLVLR